jgi:hypothetical protein
MSGKVDHAPSGIVKRGLTADSCGGSFGFGLNRDAGLTKFPLGRMFDVRHTCTGNKSRLRLMLCQSGARLGHARWADDDVRTAHMP